MRLKLSFTLASRKPELVTDRYESVSEWIVALVRAGRDLSNVNLCGADLSGQNLSNARLYGAHLTGANLRNANLYGADLRDADLTCADLSGANLQSAQVQGARLANAQSNQSTIWPRGHYPSLFKTAAGR